MWQDPDWPERVLHHTCRDFLLANPRSYRLPRSERLAALDEWRWGALRAAIAAEAEAWVKAGRPIDSDPFLGVVS